VNNRADCCSERAVPLRIDVSADGTAFNTVAQRNEPFNPEWSAEFSSTKVRYVRLTNLSNTSFHLNEVEVY
jgi:hypothetical protein